jgi:hypothetical protein
MIDQIAEGMATYIPAGEHQLAGLYVTPRPSQAMLKAWFVVATENRLIVSRAKTLWVPLAGDLEFTALLADTTIEVEHRALWDRLKLSRADGTSVQWFSRFEWRSELERVVLQIRQASPAPPAEARHKPDASVMAVPNPSSSHRGGGPATLSLALAALFLAVGLFALIGSIFDSSGQLEISIYPLVMSALWGGVGLYQRHYLQAHRPRQRTR